MSQNFRGKRPNGSRLSFNSGPRSNNSRPRRSSSNKRGTQDIHPSRFINKAAKPADVIVYEPKHLFTDFAFGASLQGNITAKGYTHPSAIQDQSIPHIIDRKDVIGLANTGTGKTAAFLLPIIDRLSGLTVRPNVLIITPTRELAQQIDDEFRIFSRGMGLFSCQVVGGTNIDRQIRELSRRPNVIVGTPGRLKDLLNRGKLHLKSIDTLVLDEADRMLDMGFLPDIRTLVTATPSDRQSLFFSATMTPDVERVAGEFLRNPVTVSVRTGETSDHVEQDVIHARDSAHKVDLLTEMLQSDGYDKVLVFSRTKHGAQRLSNRLNETSISSVAIHGNKTQSQREKALRQFKDKTARVMVATDVAARGLDIPNVTHVINFDQPATYDDYVHRIGRTGRGGAHGHAHTFVESHGSL